MVLLVVDAQRLITTEKLYAFDAFVANIKVLIAEARKRHIEVVYVRHDDGAGQRLTKGTAGFEIYEAFQPMPDERVFDKTVNSPFRESGLLQYLRGKHEKQLIIVGLQTEYCIDATMKCGFEHGFDIIVPEQTNSTFDNEYLSAEKTYQYYNHFLWNRRYASVLSLPETLERMCRSS